MPSGEDLILPIAKDSENGVAIDGRIPVHITYFTAQAEPDGEITTEADIYGHEKRISLALDGKWDQINRTTERVAELEPDDRPARAIERAPLLRIRGGHWQPRWRLVGADRKPRHLRQRYFQAELRILGPPICLHIRSSFWNSSVPSL